MILLADENGNLKFGVKNSKMKYLYLIRHGEAEEKGIRPDFERNLTSEGRKEVTKTASEMVKQKIHPSLIISSPAFRALQTAIIVAEIVGYPTSKIIQERDIYYTDASKILEIIQEQDDKLESLLLAGHNPSISYLAGMLSHESQEFMPTGGCMAYELETHTWNNFGKNKTRFLFSIFP